jgi:UDP-N-acetylmuramoyl-L-alanyl-D-glutamate--2,6-diaminopimelate ligase
MNLADLISGLAVRRVDASHLAPAANSAAAPLTPIRVCDLTEDSRTVVPGSLFVARKGAKADGGKFIADALAAGAVAVLTDDAGTTLPRQHGSDPALLVADDVPAVSAQIAERFYGHPSSKLRLIGVTGTNGKTTTTWLIHRILNSARMRCGLIGTVVVDDGVQIAAAEMTTPPAIELSRTLSVMVEAGCKAAVMETSSHALHQDRVAALRFDAAVFTNLTGDHLDYHGTMDAYAAAKAKLFQQLPADKGTAIVNGEDPYTDKILQGCKAPVLRCSVGEGTGRSPLPGGSGNGGASLCRVTALSMSMNGTQVQLDGPWGTIQEHVHLVGRYNLMNVLQAVAACHAIGLTSQSIARGLAGATAPPGRLEPVTPPGHSFAVFVDYAHTDDALSKVLATVRPLVKSGGRLFVVFGCGGDRDRTKRPRMGAAAAKFADVVIVTSDNPRTESPGSIIDQILAGIPAEQRGKVAVQADRMRAIFHAIALARPGDIVVIAGKGHETEQILPAPHAPGGTVSRHFDDREVARAALRGEDCEEESLATTLADENIGP